MQVKSKSDVESLAKTLECINSEKVTRVLTKTDNFPASSTGVITIDCPTCTKDCKHPKTKQRTYTFSNIIKKPKIEKCDPENCPYDIPCKECPRRDT